MQHATTSALEEGLAEVRRSPADGGLIEMIVRRPAHGEREVLTEGLLNCAHGLSGDNWLTRGSRQTVDGTAHPLMQLTLMNTRAATLVAGPRDRWVLAGDQIFVDLDLSVANLPAGSRLAMGTAVIEVTEAPHLGCVKFTERFGVAATRWVASESGRALRLRGANCRVVDDGRVCVGDTARKV